MKISIRTVSLVLFLGLMNSGLDARGQSKFMQLGFEMDYVYESWNTGSSLTIARNKAAIDASAAAGFKWFRMWVEVWPVGTCSPPYPTFSFDDAQLVQFKTIYQYALDKGLKVYVFSQPNSCYTQSGISRADYKRLLAAHFSYLAKKLPGVSVWQIYNEANWIHPKTGQFFCPEPVLSSCPLGLPSLPSSYMTELKEDIQIARNSIKAVNSLAQITTNVTGSIPFVAQYRSSIRSLLNSYIQTFNPPGSPSSHLLDVVGFDFYPQLSQLPGFEIEVSYFRSLYGDKFWIAETGLPSKQGAANTAGDQVTYYTKVMPIFARANVQNIILYHYQDRDSWASGDLAHYGLIDHNLFKKFGYDKIMATLALFKDFDLALPNRVSRANAAELLMSSFSEAFGRLPFGYEVFNAGGWVDYLVSSPQTRAWLVAQHVAWMNTVPAAEEDVLRRAYRNLLGREPSAYELQSWMNAVNPSYLNLSGQFTSWLNTAAGVGDRTRIVNDAYQTYLLRPPSAAESSSWVNSYIYSADGLKEQFRFFVDSP
ncbi:MAG: hypothetical protein AB7H97_03910 [Pseudobdellovibrionaceae bacterium]